MRLQPAARDGQFHAGVRRSLGRWPQKQATIRQAERGDSLFLDLRWRRIELDPYQWTLEIMLRFSAPAIDRRVTRSRSVSPGTVDRNTRPPIIPIELWRQPVTSNNVTRVDLYEAVYQKAGLSRSGSLALVELLLKEITDTLAKGETVKLSSFGSFLVRKKKQRPGRNPKTGVEVPISPRRVVVFKASAILKQQINEKRPGARAPAAELDSSAPAR
jgi:integration host factor subunit alpha